MRLIFVRHGLAVDREHYVRMGIGDEHRPLTADGIRKIQFLSFFLRRRIRDLDLIVASPFVRSMQTAEILANAYGDLPVRKTETLEPELAPQDFWNWLMGQTLLRSRDRLKTETVNLTILVVGHEPHLTRLISWLLTDVERPILRIKKGGACMLEFTYELTPGHAQLRWLTTPGILPQRKLTRKMNKQKFGTKKAAKKMETKKKTAKKASRKSTQKKK